MFGVRIVTTDHYQTAPVPGLDVCYSDFRGADVRKVPVLRIYGATPAGQKTCMHVHGVFPYLYVPYDGSQPRDRYLRQFASSLDKALNIALGHASSPAQHVFKITVVSATSFYGYHDNEQQFLKIYLYSPHMVKKVADLLLGGAVMNRILQPYESHIPYNLQMFIDYNLYGMNMINVAAVKFRKPKPQEGVSVTPPSSQGLDGSISVTPGTPAFLRSPDSGSPPCSLGTRIWDPRNIPSEMWVDEDVVRQSMCELEVDVIAADILNKEDIGDNVGRNPGLVALWDDEIVRRRQLGLSSQLSPPSSPEREDVDWSEAEAELQDRLRQIVLDLQPYMQEESEAEEEESEEQASQVIDHSQDLLSSQDTVILSGEEETSPVINERSIQRVVSCSQSFHDLRPASLPGSQPGSQEGLTELLAALAQDDTETDVVASQTASKAVADLEEQDSILSQVSAPGHQNDSDAEGEEAERAEELEMSQQAPTSDGEAEEEMSASQFDLGGMDASWNSSQWQDIGPKDDDDIPQFDGPADEKNASDGSALSQLDGPADEKNNGQAMKKKRLGMHGPSMTSESNNGSFSINATTLDGTIASFHSIGKVQQIRHQRTALIDDTMSPPPSTHNLTFDFRHPPPVLLTPEEERMAPSEFTMPQVMAHHNNGYAIGNLLNKPHQMVKDGTQGKNSPKEAQDARNLFLEHMHSNGAPAHTRMGMLPGQASPLHNIHRQHMQRADENIFTHFANNLASQQQHLLPHIYMGPRHHPSPHQSSHPGPHQSPQRSPHGVLHQSPHQSPHHRPYQSPQQSPHQGPHRSPPEGPYQSPQRSPHEAPNHSPYQGPHRSPHHQSPHRSPHQSPYHGPPELGMPYHQAGQNNRQYQQVSPPGHPADYVREHFAPGGPHPTIPVSQHQELLRQHHQDILQHPQNHEPLRQHPPHHQGPSLQQQQEQIEQYHRETIRRYHQETMKHIQIQQELSDPQQPEPVSQHKQHGGGDVGDHSPQQEQQFTQQINPNQNHTSPSSDEKVEKPRQKGDGPVCSLQALVNTLAHKRTGESSGEDDKESLVSELDAERPFMVIRRRSTDSSSTDDLQVGEHRRSYTMKGGRPPGMHTIEEKQLPDGQFLQHPSPGRDIAMNPGPYGQNVEQRVQSSAAQAAEKEARNPGHDKGLKPGKKKTLPREAEKLMMGGGVHLPSFDPDVQPYLTMISAAELVKLRAKRSPPAQPFVPGRTPTLAKKKKVPTATLR